MELNRQRTTTRTDVPMPEDCQIHVVACVDPALCALRHAVLQHGGTPDVDLWALAAYRLVDAFPAGCTRDDMLRAILSAATEVDQ